MDCSRDLLWCGIFVKDFHPGKPEFCESVLLVQKTLDRSEESLMLRA